MLYRTLSVLILVVLWPIEAVAWKSALRAELRSLHAAVAPFRDISVAKAQGWRRSTKHVPLMGEHWSQRDGVDYVQGDALNLHRPSNLIYAKIGGRHRLVAVSYVVRIGPNDPLPEGFSGPLDVWHVHNLDQILTALGQTRPLLARLGANWLSNGFAQDGNRRLAMVHVWLDGNNPLGPFVNLNPNLPFWRLGLKPEAFAPVSLDVAQGLALALPDGCALELGAKLWLAAPSGRTKRTLMRACRHAQRNVQAALARPGAALTTVATDAWRAFDSTRFLLLSDQERSRMSALVEGAGGTCRAVQ
ncbi:MAG: hypothetical protein AAF679_07300 [Pseudomonadota bacterium]